ncbi:zinc finger protein 541-like [Hemitrygon akajei]|uniref:zinc finger protein 541-like n=1 Tax=Hemitrygon akajei TaxID=2704970 RepID=UPI003BF9CA90
MDCYSFTDESSLQTKLHLPLPSDSELPIASNIQRQEFIPEPDDIIYAGMRNIDLDCNLEAAEIPGDLFADSLDLSLYTVDKGCDSLKIPSDSTDTDSPPVLLGVSPLPQKSTPEKSTTKIERKCGGLQKRRRLSTRHSPQRVFQVSTECSQCGKSFSSASALSKHYLTHSHERRHICTICSKAFKRQDHLSGHLLTHQKNKPYVCMEHGCNKSYCDSRSLRRHYEVQHGSYSQREPFPDNSSKGVDSAESLLYLQPGHTQALWQQANQDLVWTNNLATYSGSKGTYSYIVPNSQPSEEVSTTFSSGALHKLDSFAQAFTRQNLEIQSGPSGANTPGESSSGSEFDVRGNVLRQILSYKANLNQWQAFPEQKYQIVQEQYSLHQQHQQQIATSLFTQVYMGDQEGSTAQNQDQLQNHMLQLISDSQCNLSESQNSVNQSQVIVTQSQHMLSQKISPQIQNSSSPLHQPSELDQDFQHSFRQENSSFLQFQTTNPCQLSKSILPCYPQPAESTEQQGGADLQPAFRGISESHRKSKKSSFKAQHPSQSVCEEELVQSKQLEGWSFPLHHKKGRMSNKNVCVKHFTLTGKSSKNVSVSRKERQKLNTNCTAPPSQVAMNSFSVKNSMRSTEHHLQKEHFHERVQYLEDKLSELLLKKPIEESVAMPLVIPVSIPVKITGLAKDSKAEDSPITPKKLPATRPTSNDSPVQVLETGRAASVNCQGFSKKQRRKRCRAEPLFIPSPSSGQTGVQPGMALYQSHMRSPVCLAGHLLDNFQPPPYTPPPMLSPIRHGSGLYFNRICAQPGSRSPYSAFTPKDGVNGICVLSLVKDDSIIIIEPHINIGSRFQAEIPPLQDKSLVEESVHQADLVWKPWNDIETNKVTQARVTDLLNLACSSVLPEGGTNLELALHCLHDTCGDILAALDMLLMKDARRDPTHPLGNYHYTGTEKWTAAEKKMFSKAICLHKKDFFLMQKMIKHKTVAQCVEYYYTWKKQLKFEWKRTLLLEEDEEEIKREVDGAGVGKEFKNLNVSVPSQSSANRENLKKKVIRSKSSSSPSVQCQEGDLRSEKNLNMCYYPCKECTKVFEKVKSRNAHMKCHRQQEEQERQEKMKRSRIRLKVEIKEEPEEAAVVFDANNLPDITKA